MIDSPEPSGTLTEVADHLTLPGSWAVTNAGIYPIRLLWENGNGEAGNGANLEWFMVNSNGTKVLINDPSVTNTTGVTVFYSGPALPAYVSHFNPLNGMTTARADTLWAQLTDGGTTVNGGSISLKVNGSAVTTNHQQSGQRHPRSKELIRRICCLPARTT